MNDTIAIASSGLGHVSRGIEAWASDLGHALHNRGYNVILCQGGGQVTQPYQVVIPCLQRDQQRTHQLLTWLPKSIGWRLGLGSAYSVEQTTFALNLIPLLRNRQIDLLHVQDPQVAKLVQNAHHLGLVPTKTILAHGTEEPPEFLETIDYLQHLAPWHLQQTKAQGAWKPTWTAIPNFIDVERFSPGHCAKIRNEYKIPEQAVVFLSVAAIKRHHKRIDYLLNEFAHYCSQNPDADAYLIVAGGWETDTEQLIAHGQSLVGDRVRFLVRFPRERMADLYRAADVYVMSSLTEMMPIALIEAAASGLPCLIHQYPIMQWMAGPGGLPINMAQSGSLAAAMARLATLPEQRRQLGFAARQHCVEQFSADQVVNTIVDYYKYILGYTQSNNQAGAI